MEKQTDLAQIPGTPEYFRARKAAFGLIRELEAADRYAASAPRYVAGAWDEDYGDYEPIENLSPFDHLDEVIARAKADPLVVEILRGLNKLHLLNITYWEAEQIIHGEPVAILASRSINIDWQGLLLNKSCAYPSFVLLELVNTPRDGLFVVSSATDFIGNRSGAPERWTEVKKEAFSQCSDAEARYDSALREFEQLAGQVQRRYAA